MPYLSADRVKEIRNQVKKLYPEIKFSVTRNDNSSGVCITIIAAPYDFMEGDRKSKYTSVNHYYLKDHYTGKILEVFQRIMEIANEGNGIEVDDGDYGKVPHFYIDLAIGSYDRPFQFIETAAPVVDVPTVETTAVAAPVVDQPAIDSVLAHLEEEKGPAKTDQVCGKVQIVTYSEKSFAVIGDTYKHKDKLSELGGTYNKFLKCGKGWIFSNKRLDSVVAFFSKK